MTLFRRAFATVLGPAFRWALRRLPPPDDPWERLRTRMALRHYGPGVQYDFPAYLAGPSAVQVGTLDELQEWFLGCAFVPDDEQFGRDHWQHPSEFEMRRAGDCDDFAVWAWRKLVDLEMDATLVAGHYLPTWRPGGGHVWVTFRDSTGEHLFETVARTKAAMVRPLAAVRDRYRPEYGVDRAGRRFSYVGALLSLREREGIDPPPTATSAPRETPEGSLQLTQAHGVPRRQR